MICQYLKVTISLSCKYCIILGLALGLKGSYGIVISLRTFRSEKFGGKEAIEIRWENGQKWQLPYDHMWWDIHILCFALISLCPKSHNICILTFRNHQSTTKWPMGKNGILWLLPHYHMCVSNCLLLVLAWCGKDSNKMVLPYRKFVWKGFEEQEAEKIMW